MSKTLRRILAVAVLVLAFGAGFAAPEAVAVAPCGTYCTAGDCWAKCACDTPEWGMKVTTCFGCPWAVGNPCAV